MRYTEEYLQENEDVIISLNKEFLRLFDLWCDEDGEGALQDDLYEIMDKFPASRLVNTYCNSFRRSCCYSDSQTQFAEEVVLPYCLKRRIFKQDKDGNYIDNSKNIEQMPELDFGD